MNDVLLGRVFNNVTCVDVCSIDFFKIFVSLKSSVSLKQFKDILFSWRFNQAERIRSNTETVSIEEGSDHF